MCYSSYSASGQGWQSALRTLCTPIFRSEADALPELAGPEKLEALVVTKPSKVLDAGLDPNWAILVRTSVVVRRSWSTHATVTAPLVRSVTAPLCKLTC
jgi:hypothetical protein